jgi:glycosyltransferase involved in cell wall biosynthesis
MRHPGKRQHIQRTVIVHVVQRMAPGGIETLVLDLARDETADTVIVSLEGAADDLVSGWPALSEVAGKLEAYDARPGLKPALVARLTRRLRQLRPAAVYLHHVGPLVYGGIAARLAGVSRIVHVEHDVWHYATPRRRQIASLIETLVRPHHVTVSTHAAETLRSILGGTILGAPAITVIPNGIDLERFQPGDKAAARSALGLHPSWKIVGTAGRLVPVKGHDVLIEAMAHLPGACHLVIAGSGEEHQALVERTQKLSIGHRVHLIGHVDAVERILPAFDVFCLPSHAEGFPRSIIEAQAAGLPVVATNVGALSEAVCPRSGRLVAPGDPVALAAALTAALADASNEVLSDAPRTFVADRFSWQTTLSSYRSVSESKHAA